MFQGGVAGEQYTKRRYYQGMYNNPMLLMTSEQMIDSQVVPYHQLQQGYPPPAGYHNQNRNYYANDSIANCCSDCDRNAYGQAHHKAAPPPRKSVGRRPIKDKNLSPEEEQKRAIRREKNKIAAARCRQRRIDRTNELESTVDVLQDEQRAIKDEIHLLMSEKKDMEDALRGHTHACGPRPDTPESPLDIKPFKAEIRPNSLHFLPLHPVDTSGVSLTSGIFNFESLMEGGTGLTPLNPNLPSCSVQLHQRNSMTDAVKLVSL